MTTAPRVFDPAPRHRGSTQDAWTAFWTDSGQSRCVSDAPEIWQALTCHWSGVAKSLASGTRVLDLGCGAGAVARLLLDARADLQVTGIDFARVPLAIYPNFELLSDTAMESLPFGARCFGAVVSQFGFEYGQRDAAVRELAQVLVAGARLSFLVHHAHSSIVATNAARLQALRGLLARPVRAAFCAGEADVFQAHMAALQRSHPHDALIADLARCLPARLGRTQRERAAIWNSIEDALAPECCLGEALHDRCVAPAQLEWWLEPLRQLCDLAPVTVLRDSAGAPIAWSIDGIRRENTP